MGTYCDAYFGIQTFDREKYVADTKKNKNYEPVIDGGNIDTYNLKPSTEFVNYIPDAIKSGGNEKIYRQERICIRQIGAVPIATIVPANIFTLNTIYNVYLRHSGLADLKFLLGIINSKVARYHWRKMNSDEKKTFPKVKKDAILSIPVPLIKTENHRKHQAEIITSVKSILQINEELGNAKLTSKIEQLTAKKEHIEGRINEHIFELFDLNADMIETIKATIK